MCCCRRCVVFGVVRHRIEPNRRRGWRHPRLFSMNIFYLDKSPRVAAEWHGDKHVCKMIVETAQMLSTAHYVQEMSGRRLLYKPTHINHPCSVWVRENTANYFWAWHLLDSLCGEFRLRRGKVHATERLLLPLWCSPDLPVGALTPPALVMPDEFKTACPIESYRRYYRQKFADGVVAYNWLRERKPDWIP